MSDDQRYRVSIADFPLTGAIFAMFEDHVEEFVEIVRKEGPEGLRRAMQKLVDDLAPLAAAAAQKDFRNFLGFDDDA